MRLTSRESPAARQRRPPPERRLRFAALALLPLLLVACRDPSQREEAQRSVAVAVPPETATADEVAVQYLRAQGQLGPGRGELLIDLAPPSGAKLTLDAPVAAKGSGGIGLSFPDALSGPLHTHPLPLRLPILVEDGATGPADVELSYYWCTEGDDAACRRERARLSIELDLTGSGAGGEAHVRYRSPATASPGETG